MKKVILIMVVFTTFLAAEAQTNNQKQPQKVKVEYSILWGLFKIDGYANKKLTNLKSKNSKSETLLKVAPLDTTKYERKSILWGAAQWTVKKKSKTVKTQSNGK
jgi:hypothetical protein